jgi:hypothetical protein
LLGGGGRITTSVRRNQRISGKTAHVGSSPAGQAVLYLFVSGRYLHHLSGGTSVLPQQENARYGDQVPRDGEAMSLFVLHLHKVAAYLALCRDNRYQQIGHHQAYVVGSCVERPAREMDVRVVIIRYSVSSHKGS